MNNNIQYFWTVIIFYTSVSFTECSLFFSFLSRRKHHLCVKDCDAALSTKHIPPRKNYYVFCYRDLVSMFCLHTQLNAERKLVEASWNKCRVSFCWSWCIIGTRRWATTLWGEKRNFWLLKMRSFANQRGLIRLFFDGKPSRPRVHVHTNFSATTSRQIWIVWTS